MYIRAAGRAMARYKEKLALARFENAATTVFDNKSGGYANTTGTDSIGEGNGSLDGNDLLALFGQMLASGRVPTDVIMHPLAWTMWANDPILKNLFWYQNWPIRSVGAQTTDTFRGFLNTTVPFGINVITSPYVPYTAANGSTAAYTDIYVIDRNDLGVISMREDLTTDQFEDPSRDIVSMKVKERYDITIMDSDGYNIMVAKNVNVARNFGKDVAFTTSHTDKFDDEPTVSLT
jgi:hypothetical protein